MKQLFNLLDGTRHIDPYPVLTEPESVCASWHKDTMAKWYPLLLKDTMAKWYPLQESSEPVPLAGRVEGQKLKHALSFE